jgi:hypothetical protein
VLALFLRREHRYDEASALMRELSARYSRNYLFPLEEANLLRAGGHIQKAADAYRAVWQNGRAGKYGTLHYEVSALSLGDVLRTQKDFSEAAGAYELVSQVAEPDPEMLQKANLAAGETRLGGEEIRNRARRKCRYCARGDGPQAHSRSLSGIEVEVLFQATKGWDKIPALLHAI